MIFFRTRFCSLYVDRLQHKEGGGLLCSGRGRCRCGGANELWCVGQFWVCGYGQAIPIGPFDCRMVHTLHNHNFASM
jgi:hypothetical protein